jgi:hypothetical protein
VAVDRPNYSAKPFLFDRVKEIAWVSSTMQSRFYDRRRVETALESETGFHWRVIESADDEVLAIVTLWTPRQFRVFVGKTLHDFWPRNVCTELR